MAAKKRRKKRVTKRPIEERIVDISESSPYVKILVYGRNGSGKTRFAASAPKVLVADVNEEGTMSARKVRGAKAIMINQWEDMDDLYWYLKKADHGFESVAIDTLTALQALCMKHVLEVEGEKDLNKDTKMASKRDWGKATTLMGETILRFRNLPMHVVFTAQERVIGDSDEGEAVKHVPDLPAGSRAHAMGAVSIIGRIYQREVPVVKKVRGKKKKSSRWEDRMLVGPHEEYESKDRTFELGRVVRNPTVPLVLEAAFSDIDDEEE